jgi:hypothetical protein
MSLKSIYTAPSRTDAVIICNLLQSAGIEATVRTDTANGNFPSLEVAEGVDVLVDESVAGEALAVLEEYRSGATAIDDDQAV